MTTLAHRLATRDDLRFIRNSWIDNYRMSRTAGPMPAVSGTCTEIRQCPACGERLSVDRGYHAAMGPILDWLFARPGVECWVAFKPGELPPDDLYGWVCIERGALEPVKVREGGQWVERMRPTSQPVVHYVYTRQMFRGFGVARGLFKAAGVDPAQPFIFTASTAAAARLRAKAPGGRFDTRLARFPKNEPYEGADDEDPVLPVPDGPEVRRAGAGAGRRPPSE